MRWQERNSSSMRSHDIGRVEQVLFMHVGQARYLVVCLVVSQMDSAQISFGVVNAGMPPHGANGFQAVTAQKCMHLTAMYFIPKTTHASECL